MYTTKTKQGSTKLAACAVAIIIATATHAQPAAQTTSLIPPLAGTMTSQGATDPLANPPANRPANPNSQQAAPPTAPSPTAQAAPVPAPAPTAQKVQPMPTVTANSGTAHEIQKINESMTILQAQLNQLELQVKVATRKNDLNKINGTGNGFSSFDSAKGNPSVVSVAGLKGALEAILVFPGGATQRVKAGDVIDDRRIEKISVNEVILTDLKGKNSQRLAFGTTATIREAASSSGQIVPGMGAVAPQR